MHSSNNFFVLLFILLICSINLEIAVGEPNLFNDNSTKKIIERAKFNYGEFLREEGRFDKAFETYKSYVKKYPTSLYNVEANYYLALSALKIGKISEANHLFKKFNEKFPLHHLSAEATRYLKEIEEGNGRDHVEMIVSKHNQEVEPLKAVQVLVFQGQNLRDIRKELREIKKDGADTIILRVFHNKGDRVFGKRIKFDKSGFYFKTTEGPVLYDLLSPVTKMARAEGLKVFAWMTTRYSDYGVENRGDLKCKAYDVKKDSYYNCKGLDIFNPQVITRLEKIYSDLGDYDIDGVLFQDDLVLKYNEGFSRFALKDFKKQTGFEITPSKLYALSSDKGKNSYVGYTTLFWKWSTYKNEKLLDLALRLKRKVNEKNPNVKFAVNLMYESLTAPEDALAWLSQDLRSAYELGFEYFSVMAYHRQMAKELNKSDEEVQLMIEQMVSDAVRIVGSKERVLIKIQTKDWDTGRKLSESELKKLIRAVKSVDDVSLALVPYRKGLSLNELIGRNMKAKAVGRRNINNNDLVVTENKNYGN